jgi:hypothetical protein
MEGTHHHEETSIDPPMTPIERQMQVIATSIQDLARETTRQNKKLWHAIRKGPPTSHDDNQPPPQRENRSDDQEADSRQVTRHRNDEVQKTPSPNRHGEESVGSSTHPSRQRPDKTTQSFGSVVQTTRSFSPIVQKAKRQNRSSRRRAPRNEETDGRHEE